MALVSSFLLTGCGSSQAEIDSLKSMESLNTESEATEDYNMSLTDQQSMIYAQVSNRQLLDLSTLTACSDNELQQVVNYMNGVDEQLVGITDAESGVIEDCFVNYLLTEFERTPYYWQRTKTEVKGMESESRSVIVDVTYATLGFKKKVIPDSKIVKGDPNYETQMKTRWNRFVKYFTQQKSDGNAAARKKFETNYGTIKEIYKSQSNFTPADYVYENANQRTFTGCVDSEAENSGATMTVRYVLVPRFAMGVNLGMYCKHMYVTNYSLDSDFTSNLSLFTSDGYATVTDNVYELIHSYFQCIDESDFNGLYKLTTEFASLDKYYQDMFNYIYSKHDNFTLSLFDITGTNIKCGVTMSSKTRARGSNITYPTYTDRYYVEVELVGEQLKVKNMVLLSKVLESEPAISVSEADTAGFTADIQLDNDDKVAIEKLICDFGALQLKKDTKSDDFGKVVDLSMTVGEQDELKEAMQSLGGVRKVVWLNNYQQGIENYASVKCKELYQDKTNYIVEADTTYEFMRKGARWYVYKFTINSSVRLDTTTLQSAGCLCLVSPGKVEAYTSQVKSAATTDENNTSDIAVTYNHKPYTPSKKHIVREQGLVKLTADKVTSDIFNALYSEAMIYEDYQKFLIDLKSFWDTNKIKSSLYDDFCKIILEGAAVKYNRDNNRYTTKEFEKAKDSITKKVSDLQIKVGTEFGKVEKIDTTIWQDKASNLLWQINGRIQ